MSAANAIRHEMNEELTERLTGKEARERAVWLEITSFRGVSIGATHYYGSLKINHSCNKFPCDCSRVYQADLKRTLTASQAKDLTKLQNDGSLFNADYRWEAGDETKCFDTQEDVIGRALAAYQEIFPDKTLLLLGRNTWVYPDAILHDATGKFPVCEVREPA